jgi:hypothetical protein
MRRSGIQPDMPADPATREGSPVEPKRAAHSGNSKQVEERGQCSPELREKMLDKTLADTFPSSDSPSTNPNPCPEDPSDSEI